MTVMDYEDPADPSPHEPTVTGSPDEIWLVYGDLERDATHAECYRDGEVTWCADQQFASDVRYVRADLLGAAVGEPVARIAPRLPCLPQALSRDDTEYDVDYYTADQMREHALDAGAANSAGAT